MHRFIYQASYRTAVSGIECTLESLLERRNHLTFTYEKRQNELKNALKLREWECEVDQVKTFTDYVLGVSFLTIV